MASIQSGYSLPNLSRVEVVGVLEQYQIIVSETDLANPTSNFVFNLYPKLLQVFDSFQDDHFQIDFESLERFENPDMHRDAIGALNLFGKVCELLEAIECPISFTLPDLLRPNPSRTLKFVIAIINFFLLRGTKISMLQPYSDELEALEEEFKQRETKVEQLRKEIEKFKEEREREKPLALEAEAKANELQQTLDNLNTLQSKLRKERQAIKEKVQEVTNTVSNSEYELIQASEENAILRSKIVQSPDKLQSALEEKKVMLMEAKDYERQTYQSFQEKTASLEVYSKASQKMTKQLAHMQTIQEQVNSAKSVEKDVKQLKAKLSDDQMLEKSLEAKQIELQNKAEQSDEQKHLINKEAKLRHEVDAARLNSVKLDADQFRNNLEARGQNIFAVVAEVDAMKVKIKSTKDLAVATQEELLKRGEEIVNELNLYARGTMQMMSKIDELQFA